MLDNPKKEGRLVQLQPSCCFTAGVATLNGDRKLVKCQAHERGHNKLMVVCRFCPTHRDKTNVQRQKSAYRCVSCYRAFQIAIEARVKKLGSFREKLPPSVLALLEIQWAALVDTAADDEPSVSDYGKHLTLIDRSRSHDMGSEGEGHCRRFMLQWKEQCPSCYDWAIPSVPPIAEKFALKFASLQSKVMTRKVIFMDDVPSLDPTTGVQTRVSSIKLFVDTVEMLITQDEAGVFKHRFADEHQYHKGYKGLMLSEEERCTSVANQEVWHLVRTASSRNEPSVALSLNWIGALTKMKNNLNEPRNFAEMFGRVHRRSAPYKGQNSGLLPKNVDELVKKYALRDCSLRVNRLGGPFGHANGQQMSVVRADVVSPHVDNSLPRNNPNSTVLVPTFSVAGLVTGVTPFYVAAGTSKNHTMRVTQPRHAAIPRHSSVATGDRLMKTILKDSILKDKNSATGNDDTTLAFMHTFVAAIYKGSYLLQALADSDPWLATSTVAVKQTVANEIRRRKIYETGQRRSETRSVTSTGRTFIAGQAVFWKDPDGLEWSANLVRIICKSDSDNMFEIMLHRDMADGGGEGEMRTVGCSEISPDLSADGLGDDDEYEFLIPSSDYDRKFAVAAKTTAAGANYLSRQVQCGEYTLVHDASGGHRDHFTHCDGALLENKSSFVLGNPDSSVSLSNSEGTVPPGALAYPRAKVFTANYAMDDIELHQLHGEIHLCSRYQPSKNDCRRGAWCRRKIGRKRGRGKQAADADKYQAVYYPSGFAVLDWESKAQHG
jgi:hypothetical protein